MCIRDSHIAASVGNLFILTQLYDREIKPDLNLQTKQGTTALHLSVAKKHLSVCKFLIDNGASVRLKDQKGQLPLHRAASIGSMTLVELLCTQGKSPVNVRDKQGWTPLFHALAEGHGDIALLLVNKYDADVQLEDNAGKKPADVALNEQVKKFFLQNLA